MKLFKRKPAEPTKISAAAQMAVDLLGAHHEWTCDEFYATHFGGAMVWIANPHLTWSYEFSVPKAGVVIPKGGDCKASADHKAVRRAVTDMRDAQRASALSAYVASLDLIRSKRAREAEEIARRLEFEAGSHDFAAAEKRRQAEAQRKSATEDQP